MSAPPFSSAFTTIQDNETRKDLNNIYRRLQAKPCARQFGGPAKIVNTTIPTTPAQVFQSTEQVSWRTASGISFHQSTTTLQRRANAATFAYTTYEELPSARDNHLYCLIWEHEWIDANERVRAERRYPKCGEIRV
jgi:hypothetical protein